MKMNDTTMVFGKEALEAMPRVGTKCRICGEPISNADFFKISTPSATSAFVHRACVRERGYHEKFTSPSGKTFPLFGENSKVCKDELLFTPELETSDFHLLTAQEQAQLLGTFRLYAEHDGSLWPYGSELHPVGRCNLHGMKEFFQSLEKRVDMTDSKCGLHVHFSWNGMTSQDVEKIQYSEVFAPVLDFMASEPDSMKDVFGRYANDYCEIDAGTSHYSGIHFIYGLNAHIEYRFGHYSTAQRTFWMLALYAAWTKEIKAFCECKQDAKRTSKHLLKLYQKHVDGTALYQRPERNK